MGMVERVTSVWLGGCREFVREGAEMRRSAGHTVEN